jgi:putative Holliday junction resolvase
MRLLGIDYGDVRIGVAISDPLGLTAQPVGTISNGPGALDELVRIINEKKVQRVVVGCPKNQHGDDSKKAKDVRRFVDALLIKIPIDVEFVDERFSTVAVTKHLIHMDVSRKKRKSIVDTQAAMFILQGVLNRRP